MFHDARNVPRSEKKSEKNLKKKLTAPKKVSFSLT